MILLGTLAFDYKAFQLTDGVNWYYTIAPSLLFRLIFRKVKRPLIAGKALIFSNIIIWHKKEKFIYRYIPLKKEEVWINWQKKDYLKK